MNIIVSIQKIMKKNISLLKSKMTIILIIFLTISISGFSYQKKQHALITNNAITMFEKRTGSEIDSIYKKAFIKGLERDDRKSPYRLVYKLFHMHFFNPYHIDEVPSARSANKRLKQLYERLNQQLKSTDSESDIIEVYKTLGNICHYLQDFTNPCHVIPIYHTGNDSFDKYELTQSMFNQSINTKLYAELDINDNSYLSKLIILISTNTLISLDNKVTIKENNTLKEVPLTDFWKKKNNELKPWFSTYGQLANSWGRNKDFWINPNCDNFKQEERRYSEKEKKGWIHYELQKQDTDVFTSQQICKARDVTIMALEYLNRRLYPKG